MEIKMPSIKKDTLSGAELKEKLRKINSKHFDPNATELPSPKDQNEFIPLKNMDADLLDDRSDDDLEEEKPKL